MDFLTGSIKTLYFKYLAAAFGSALVTSIYSIVDMAMVGRYHGPEGTAALAVVAPIWNIIYGLGNPPFEQTWRSIRSRRALSPRWRPGPTASLSGGARTIF